MSDIQATFSFNDEQVIIGGKSNECMKDLFRKFCAKTNENYDDMVFLYDVSDIPNLKISKVSVNSKINILAYKKNYNDTEKRSKFLICPVCKNNNKIKNCIIKMKDYKIVLDECDNDHNYGKILLEEIGDYSSQLIDETKIVCSFCKEKTKASTFQNKFYKCSTCKKDYCPLCKDKHNLEKGHNVIDYDESYFLCEEHHDRYIYYCKMCHKNLCFECLSAHNKNHKLIDFKDIVPEKGLKFDDFEKSFEDFKNVIDNLINILKKVKSNFQIYYNLAKDIKNNFNSKDRNYQIFKNAKNIEKYNSEIMEKMNEIKKLNEIEQFSSILELYNTMTNKNSNDNDNNVSKINNISSDSYDDANESFSIKSSKKRMSESSQSQSNLNMEFSDESKEFTNEIKIKYDNDKNIRNISLLGKRFIENNKNKFEIYYNGNKINISNSYDKKKYKFNNNPIEIKLKIIEQLTDMSYMFYDCSSLIEICNIDKIDTRKVTNMSFLFAGCKSLRNLPDILDWETENVTNMKYMFGECHSLTKLPNVSNWKTNEVTDMSYMFTDCKELQTIPNISEWNTSKVKDMSGMFCGCTKLSRLNGLQKWDIKNVVNANYMFNNCTALNESIINRLNFDKETKKYQYH